MLLLQLA